jgi:uncharacterized cupredoxin-like copper-binding protein
MKRLWIASLLLMLLIVAGGCATPSTDRAQKVGEAGSPSTEQTATAAETFKAGDIVKKGNFEAAASTVIGDVKSSNQFEKPGDGKKYFAVQFQLKNTGKESEQISTLLQFKLKDSGNAQYDVALVSQPEPKFPDGELTAGETAQGFVTFEIPTGATGLKFIFDSSVFGSGRITWDLGV